MKNYSISNRYIMMKFASSYLNKYYMPFKIRCIIIMKKFTFLSLLVLIICINSVCQAENLDYQRVAIEAKKRLQIAKNMNFTRQEDKDFWNLYSEYERALDNIYRDKFDLIQNFRSSNASRNITDDQANEFVEQFFEIENRKITTKQSYVEKFKAILPGRKVARFYQIDNKLDAIINHELAIKIELLE